MLTDPAAPRCKHCSGPTFRIPGQHANLGWLCGCCDPTGSTCEHRARPAVAPVAPAAPLPANAARIPEGLHANPFTIAVWASASGLSARYFGCPVYLVGGALTDPDPRDLDLIVALPDELFVASYGEGPWDDNAVHRELDAWEMAKGRPSPAPIWRRWARDCAKQSRILTEAVRRAVDFKVQPQRAFDAYLFQPRVRLDCAFMPEPPADPASR